MNDFLKTSALILVSIILCLVLSGQNKYFSAMISMLVCVIVAITAMEYTKPVLEFFGELKTLGQWNSALFSILMKSAGIGIIMQIVALLCNDSGNSALGKCIQFLGTSVILWISLPLFTELIKLVNELLGRI
jgi:stage III sporulation protein AD